MYQRGLGVAPIRVAPSTQLIWALLLASSALLSGNALRGLPGRPDSLVALVAGGLVGVAWMSIPAISASGAW